jgi:hypothetical protein
MCGVSVCHSVCLVGNCGSQDVCLVSIYWCLHVWLSAGTRVLGRIMGTPQETSDLMLVAHMPYQLMPVRPCGTYPYKTWPRSSDFLREGLPPFCLPPPYPFLPLTTLFHLIIPNYASSSIMPTKKGAQSTWKMGDCADKSSHKRGPCIDRVIGSQRSIVHSHCHGMCATFQSAIHQVNSPWIIARYCVCSSKSLGAITTFTFEDFSPSHFPGSYRVGTHLVDFTTYCSHLFTGRGVQVSCTWLTDSTKIMGGRGIHMLVIAWHHPKLCMPRVTRVYIVNHFCWISRQRLSCKFAGKNDCNGFASQSPCCLECQA